MSLLAVSLVGLLCRGLNEADVPFVFKCRGHENGYDRRDSGVLYMQARYYLDAACVLKKWYARLADTMTPDIPLFTKRLAGAIGFAEEPECGSSFGRHRCRLFPEGLMLSWMAFQIHRTAWPM